MRSVVSRRAAWLVGAFAVGAAACGESAPYVAAELATPRVSVPRVERSAGASSAKREVPALALQTPPAPEVSPPPVPSIPRASLERPAALRAFFDAIGAIEDKGAIDDVRIVQLGDSHTAADWYTGVVRRALQQRFGDGGRGFVAIGKPWKGYVQEGIKVGMTREWVPEHARLVRGKLVGDGFYGLTGVAVGSARPGGSAWVEVQDGDRVEVAYLAQPSGGPFDLLVDGAQIVRVSTKSNAPAVKFHGLDVGSGSHRIEVRASSAGKVRVFGAAVDRKAKGVVLDSFGRDGARAAGLLHWNAEHVTELLKWRNPALTILAFGTNECGDKDVSTATYERDLAAVVGRIVRALPSASCLILGPPDYVQYGPEGPVQHPRLVEIIAAQRRVAEAAHCAFYDQMSAMGGAGSIAAWAQEQPPRARKDGVHLSREGYAQLATAFVDEVQRSYDTFRADQAQLKSQPVAKR